MFSKVFSYIIINVLFFEIIFAQTEEDFQDALHPVHRTYATIDQHVAERLEELRLIMDVPRAKPEEEFQNTLHPVHRTYATIDQKVADKLEELRLIMDVGDPARGIPILDPLELLKVAFSFNEPLLNVNVKAYELKVKGGKSFVVNSMSTKLLPPQTTFDFSVPEVSIRANLYSMTGRYMKLLPVIASGEMDVFLYNLNVKGHAKLGISNGSPQLKEFIIYLDAERVKTNLRGIQGSKAVSQIVNKLISNFAPSVMRSRKELISKHINATVVPLANQLLSKMTLQDLINLL